MKKQSYYTWVDRAFFVCGVVWLILHYALPRDNTASYIIPFGFALIALIFLEKILQFIVVYRAETKDMSFIEAFVSMRAKQFNYPGKIWIHLIATVIFLIFILQNLLRLISNP
ncbi:MAG: hypothetical protein P1P90_03945 [Patescibacteria group bacterium]|nr:hypothetical protein [Patescibacteria group bacterium]